MFKGWYWVGTFTGAVVISVGALPLAVLAVVILARRRRGSGDAWRTSVAEVGLVYGTVPTVWLTMLPGSEGRVSLVPLRDLFAIIAAGPASATMQIVGNLLVFAAFGFFGPIRFVKLASMRRILAIAASCSILIETLQYVLSLDRVSSVDDVLLNTAGAGLAALASRHWWRARSEPGSHTTAI